MFESFAVNVMSSIFIDAAKVAFNSLRNSEIAALKDAFKVALKEAAKTYALEHGEDSLSIVEKQIISLVENPDARYLLLNNAIDGAFEEQEVDLRDFCIRAGIDFDSLAPFLQYFFAALKAEIELAAEEHNNPLTPLVLVRGQKRTEKLQRDLLARMQNLAPSQEKLNLLQSMLSDSVAEKLASLQKKWHQGDIEQILDELQAYRSNSKQWNEITKPMQAQWLRTEATFLIEIRKQVQQAKDLLTMAKEIYPDSLEDTYAQALVAFVEASYEATLKYLADANDESSINLRAVTYLALNRIEDADAVLAKIPTPAHIHTYYTKARLALKKCDVNAAEDSIRQALVLAPNSDHMRFWLAQLKYLSILSPIEQPDIFQSLPEPIPPIFYRSAPKHIRTLKEAADIFQQLRMSRVQDLRHAAEL